jgi:CHAT domain
MPASCRVLIVISRPDLTDDVPMTSVASQIVRAAVAAGMPLSIEVARPPTIDSVESLLRRADSIGLPYGAVHFDGHGVFHTEEELVRSGLSIWPEHEDRPATVKRGFLIFEGPGGSAEAISGRRLGKVCYDNGVRCVVLNACQSATEVAAGTSAGEPQVDAAPQDSLAYGSLASELLRCGMAGVVAMRYAVRVEAAAAIMRALIDDLCLVHRYDQRGTGGSSWQGEHTIARHVHDLALLLDV